MPAPYFMKSVWPEYAHGENKFGFGHLAESYMVASDSVGVNRNIIVIYQDHVFTRDPVEGDSPSDAFPDARREPYGVFCPDRYRWSLVLPQIVSQLPGERIWNLRKDDRYAHVPVVTENGDTILYSIVFSLEAVRKNIPYEFLLRVRTAYPCTDAPPDTFGDVRFSHLLMVRAQGTHTHRNYTSHRKMPKMPE